MTGPHDDALGSSSPGILGYRTSYPAPSSRRRLSTRWLSHSSCVPAPAPCMSSTRRSSLMAIEGATGRRMVRLVRTLVIALVAGLGGLAIAYVDSRRTWDDTGVTAAALFALAAATSVAAGARPWLWTILVGGPLV